MTNSIALTNTTSIALTNTTSIALTNTTPPVRALETKKIEPASNQIGASFPKPVEAGGDGDCAIWSLWHQTTQRNGQKWSTNKKRHDKILQLRQAVAGYMKTNAPKLALSEGFCNDILDDWSTVFNEEFNSLIKSQKHDILSLIKTLYKVANQEEDPILEAYLLEMTPQSNWTSALSALHHVNNKGFLEYLLEQEVKTHIIESYASYMASGSVQLDKTFWNAYTQMSRDDEFLENHQLNDETCILKQVLVIQKINKAYATFGFWPKEEGVEQIRYSECAYIFYNGKSHFQSFDRDRIVDYLTMEQNGRPQETGCIIS